MEEKVKTKQNIKKKTPHEINLLVKTYKTHDLLNNSRIRICSSNTKLRL